MDESQRKKTQLQFTYAFSMYTCLMTVFMRFIPIANILEFLVSHFYRETQADQ